MERTLDTITSNSAADSYISSQVRAEGIKNIYHSFVSSENCNSSAQKIKALHLLPLHIGAVCNSVPGS